MTHRPEESSIDTEDTPGHRRRAEGREADSLESEGPGDGEVVAAVLSGDQEAFALLVQRYQDVLYRYAERMTGRPDEAADVVQLAFIKGYRNLHRCRQPSRVGGWLFRIAANLCKDRLKSRHRRDVSLEKLGTLPGQGGNPERGAERAEIRDEIHRALAALTADQREAFVLKHVEGWSYEEMSERLEVSIPALKMRVHRAREELQILLRRYR